jgi:TRAP-type uncharacterized transport system substrate-binding protein
MHLVVFLIFVFGFISPANATDMGIVTGSNTGTYIQIGKNLSRLAQKYGT